MDRLEIAIALIQEAQAEKQRLDKIDGEIKKLRGLEDAEYWQKRAEIYTRFAPFPRKSIINENLKVARRLLKDEYI